MFLLTAEMTIEISAAVGILWRSLEREGVVLQTGHDFVKYEESVSKASRDLTEHFAINLHTITPVEGFWMTLHDQQMRLVGTVAARLDQLGPMTLDQHWKQYLPRVYKDAAGVPVQIADRQHAFSREVCGKVIYLGEMWITPSRRENGLASTLARLVQLVSLQLYDPDFVYCWMWADKAESGFAQSCGYVEIVRRGIRWKTYPAGNEGLKDLWLAGNRKSRLYDLALDVLHDAQASPNNK